jgi:hypothetical protein
VGRRCGLGERCTALAAEVGGRRVFRHAFCAILCERTAALRAEVISRGISRPALRATHRFTLFSRERPPPLLSPVFVKD